ncbi:la-related protein 1C isoform X1 [Iris pallida]|uniref:La-related protein 1C isoform X1 n=1 Tax=Iris pallida TaxID=29817 RepID=A0AAX6EH67_IRIPA|nr:la-related protein 1C isoform X1 [Iris pallida]KAJ6811118.1 la-related protein 1C isoform X1 [Iris pallida]
MASPSPPPSSASNAIPRNPWNRNPQPIAAAATAAATPSAAPVLAEEPWPPLTVPQIAAGEAQPAAEAAFDPVPQPQPIPNRSPNPSGSRRGGRNSHYNHQRRNHGFFHHQHHQNRFPAPSFSPPPHHVRSPNPNLAFNPLPMPMPMQPPQQPVWVLMQTRDWGTMVSRAPLYQNGYGYNGYNDGVFAPPLYPHPMVAAHQQFPPMGPPAPVPGGPPAAPNRDVQLMEDIRRQIEYYFSEENLVKDAYLKQKMDEFGWVDLGLIGNFRKVAALTKDMEMIKSAMAASDVVQLEGDKIRTRYHWQRWTSK